MTYLSVIQICNVKPIPEPCPIILAPDIPEKIAKFYYYNDVRRFQCDRPVHKGIVDKENEIKVTIVIYSFTSPVKNFSDPMDRTNIS